MNLFCRPSLPLHGPSLLVVVLLAGLAGHANACTAVNSQQAVDGTVTVANADPVGKRLGTLPWTGNATAFLGCSGRQPLVIDLDLVGLTYVQDVQVSGLTYPAYAVDATSPLLIFKHNSGYFGGSSLNSIALRMGRNVDPNGPVPFGTSYRSQVLAYAVSRGGVMTAMPYTALGVATVTVQNFPSIWRAVPISIGIDVLPPTCTLSAASLVLDPISADQLRAAGDAGGDMPLEVAMRCPGAGVRVGLTLTDAHDTGNTGSALSPTADSDVRGVRIQLIRNTVPVQLGQRWEQGISAGGTESLTFGARYLRTAQALVPGEIKGEAVLSADYR